MHNSKVIWKKIVQLLELTGSQLAIYYEMLDMGSCA